MKNASTFAARCLVLLVCGMVQACRANIYTSRVTVVVHDDDGLPVTNAQVEADFTWGGDWNGRGEHVVTKKGATDSNGVFETSGPSVNFLVIVKQTGFYDWQSKTKTLSYYKALGPKKEVLIKEDPTIPVTLSKIGHTISLFAFKFKDTIPPVTNSAVGFDLVAGDWIAPFGQGHTADIFFELESAKRSKQDIENTLTLSFPNKGDGIVSSSFTPSSEFGSVLQMRRAAPADGYVSNKIVHLKLTPGHLEQDYDEHRCYFFRMRTAMDGDRVVSALYGKTSGDFHMDYSGVVEWTYYVNPTPNERNLEWNGKNLTPHGSSGIHFSIPAP